MEISTSAPGGESIPAERLALVKRWYASVLKAATPPATRTLVEGNIAFSGGPNYATVQRPETSSSTWSEKGTEEKEGHKDILLVNGNE